MKEPVSLKVTLPKIPDIELVALEGLDRLAQHWGIDKEKIGEAKLAVTEAIVNAFEHAGDGNQVVNVEFTLSTEKLEVFIRDFGKGFAPGSVEEPDIRKKLGAENKRGWGLKLMKSLSDDFRIESDSGGTRITITKLLT
jgi:serine/threonine-protein kinase RsbW